jgi:hypothetical protein
MDSRRWTLIASLYFICTGCGLVAQPLAIEAESSCGFVQDSYGRRVSWDGRLPIRIVLAKDWPADFVDPAKRAADAWNAIAERTLIEIVSSSSEIAAYPTVDQVNGLYWTTEWSDERSYIQAATNLLYLGNIAKDADIKVNAKHFRFYTENLTDPPEIHMESLLIHEIGHLLGLKHFMTPPTVMEPSLAPNFVRATISSTDKESLLCEYGQ